MVSFICPNCKSGLENPDEMGGRQDICPACKTLVTVPLSKEQKKAEKIRKKEQKEAERIRAYESQVKKQKEVAAFGSNQREQQKAQEKQKVQEKQKEPEYNGITAIGVIFQASAMIVLVVLMILLASSGNNSSTESLTASPPEKLSTETIMSFISYIVVMFGVGQCFYAFRDMSINSWKTVKLLESISNKNN